jgi:MFS transporter, DHA1 family, tetracycline resistance protein
MQFPATIFAPEEHILSSAVPTAPAPETGRAAFVFILITVALDFLAVGLIIPILPDLIRQFEGGDFARASVVTGYFGFAWATMQFLFSPILGAWSDRFGRRPIILISCFGLGIDYVFMALAPSLLWLAVGRIISGVTASNISSAFAYITDVTPPEKRAKQFGLISAAFGLGFVIGPAVGGLLGNINLRLPFWAAAGLSLANAIYGFFILPESLPKERRAKSAWHMANPLGALTLLRSARGLSGLGLIVTLNYLAQQALPSIYVLYADFRYGWSHAMIGVSLAIVGVFISVVSGGVVGPFVKRFGERRSLFFGLAIGVLAFAGFASASRSWMLFAALPFLSLWGISGPAAQSLMTQLIDPTSQGKLQGAIGSLRSFAGMIGPLIFTQVFALAISPRATVKVPGAPYFLSALLLLASLLFALNTVRPGEAVQPAPQTAS